MPAPSAPLMKQFAKQKLEGARGRGALSPETEKYLDNIIESICSAWATWQASAVMVGVVITGPTAAGGQFVGPPLGPLILAKGPKIKAQELKLTTAIADAIGTGWLNFIATVKAPGMPWYPAFAAVPAPAATPMPNVPCPFMALSMATASISAPALKSQMVSKAGDSANESLLDAIADAFEKSFNLWRATTMVTRVMGSGPVPTFAPPYVPVGPVVRGVGTMTPGGLL